MVITLNICKICVHSHKNYLVYKNLCKVCLITLNYRENVHMSHIFIMFFSSLGKNLHISIFVAFFGREIWEISQLALISVTILVIHWQISGLQSKF